MKILDVDWYEGNPYYVMEYFPAGSLRNRLTSGPPPSRERILEWISALAHALDHCHERGLVHRDVKPSNILLDLYDRPVLADFGLVSDLESVGITHSGDRVGTPAFMSPEQTLPSPTPLDHRTDLYSLGTVLYWLLSGITPFEARSLESLMERIRNDLPVPLRRLRRQIPADLDAIVRTAMAKDPARRYPTARAMATDLELHSTDRPILARPPGTLDRLHRWARRHRGFFRSIYGLVALIYGGFGWITYQEFSDHRVARRIVDSLLEHLRTGEGRLLHVYRKGEAAGPAFLEDHTHLVWALIELYEAGFEARDLEAAMEITGAQIALFWDEEGGGFYRTGSDVGEAIHRPVLVYDGARPSGNSVALSNLIRLARSTDRPEFEERARRSIRALAGRIQEKPSLSAGFLIGLDLLERPATQIVVAGDPTASDTQALLRTIHRRFLPGAVLMLRPSGDGSDLPPHLRKLVAVDGKATAYVCRDFVCQRPTGSAHRLAQILDEEPRGR